MSQRRYFGTDGVRGAAGEPPMTAEFAFRLGAAAADHLRDAGPERPRLLVGMDTRRSGPMLAHAVVAGITSRGADATWLGVLPTPGVAYLVQALEADAGVVISASHNPYTDNGIKFFGAGGVKLSDADEAAIEARLEASLEASLGGASPPPPVTGDAIGTSRRYRAQDADYEQYLLSHAPYLDGLRLGLDCANGAASGVGPRVFGRIGARLDVIHAAPDGRNINANCGSTHPETIRARVLAHELDVGVTFDGDADRALLVDRRGRLVSGDHILAINAVARGEREVVATVMSNLGLERFLAERGIALQRVAVGDRYVREALDERGLTLGGEQSGHVLFLDKAPTGDGLLTALQTLSAVRKSGRRLEQWMDEIPVFPQVLRSVRVPASAKAGLAEHDEVQRALASVRDELGDDGRVNLRASGTEPLIRVMVEGPEREQVERLAARLVEVVTDTAGAQPS